MRLNLMALKYALLVGFVERALQGKHLGCYADYGELAERVKAWRDKDSPSPNRSVGI